jgi:histone-lysine N-methyltransferase SETMAR
MVTLSKPLRSNEKVLIKEISDNIPSVGCNADDWDSAYEGCKCGHDENSTCFDNCKCTGRTMHFKLIDNTLHLDIKYFLKDGKTGFLKDCNQECTCNPDTCLNRTAQNGCKFDLELFETENKGTCVRTKERIRAGAFVIEYMGEVIDISEGKLRLDTRQALNESNYILVLREHFNEKILSTCIDARNYGNLARFINHSCEPNMVVIPWRIDNVIPHACLFAIRDINPMEELSYDYNGATKSEDSPGTIAMSRNQCFCMSNYCRGFLPANKF